MCAAGHKHKVRYNATCLRIETHIERQIHEKCDNRDRDPQQQNICEPFPIPASFAHLCQSVAKNDQCGRKKDIPRIEESQPTYNQSDNEEACLADLEFTEE